jgi:hypothetical protein
MRMGVAHVRLVVWTDGRVIVYRAHQLDEPPVASIPIDPASRRGYWLWTVVGIACLLATVPAGVGAVVLLVGANVVSGLGCLIATLLLSERGFMITLNQLRARPPGHYITLEPAAAAEYFDAVEGAKRSLRPSSTRDERTATAERLWTLANELSEAQEAPL